jgi:hypothetical protein
LSAKTGPAYPEHRPATRMATNTLQQNNLSFFQHPTPSGLDKGSGSWQSGITYGGVILSRSPNPDLGRSLRPGSTNPHSFGSAYKNQKE